MNAIRAISQYYCYVVMRRGQSDHYYKTSTVHILKERDHEHTFLPILSLFLYSKSMTHVVVDEVLGCRCASFTRG